MTSFVLSLAMLTAMALVAGAIVLLRRGLRKQPVLMLILAAVMIGNVVIWSIPTQSGESLVDRAEEP
jgi:carbon starvation protein CstA